MSRMDPDDTEENADDINNAIPAPSLTVHKLPNSEDAQKTVLVQGDNSQFYARPGSTGEVSIVLNSVTGLEHENTVPQDIVNSRYFSTESCDCEFEIGTGQTTVDREFEKHLQTFLAGEKSNLVFTVCVEEQLNCKNRDTSKHNLSLTVDCDVSLVSLLNADPLHKWFPETKLSKARQYYSLAVDLFKQSRYLDSFHLFQSSYRLTILALGPKVKNPEDEVDAEVVSEVRKLSVGCLNNMAACHFQWSNHQAVVSLSSRVLELSPDQVKALYRRGVSYLKLSEFEKSEDDLVRAARLEPGNRAVQEQLGVVKSRKKGERKDLANKLSKMFAT